MRTWMITLVGLGGALILDTGVVRPVLSPSGPALAAAGIAIYAGLVWTMTAALFVIGLRRIRFRLARNALTRDGWIALFAATGLEKLATRIVDLAPAEGAAGQERLVLQSRFDVANARRETRHLYWSWLIRTNFFTSMALLLVMFGWELSKRHALFLNFEPVVLAAPPLGLVVTLVTLSALGRLAVDTAFDPMLDMIATLPLERLDIGLLRTLTALAERAGIAPFPGPSVIPAMALESILERLSSAFEEIRNSLHNSTTRLGANADLLTAAARALSEGPRDVTEIQPDRSAGAELKAAIEELTLAIERLPAVAAQMRTDPREIQTVPDADLGRELRELLKELE